MSDFDEFEQNLNVPRKDSNGVITHAYETYKGVLGITVVVGVILVGAGIVLNIFFGPSRTMSYTYNSGDMRLMMSSLIGMYGRSVTFQLLLTILLSPLYVGIIYICHKKCTGKNVIFQDVLIGFKQNTANIMVFSLITTLLTYILAALCVFPVIFVMPLFFLGYPFLLFENCSFTEALSKSYNVVKENYWSFVGIAILSFLISILGVLACGVGYILTFGFIYAAMYSAYLAFVGTPKETAK